MVFDFLSNIIFNKIFLSAFWAWFVAQAMKSLIGLIVNMRALKINIKDMSEEEKEDISMWKDMMSSLFWKTGGMPSSHASMTSAMTLAVGFEEGFSSSLFIVAFFFTGIVFRDATGVRLLTGRLARIANIFIEDYNSRHEDSKNVEKIKVVEGHTVTEVFVGMVLGAIVCVLVYLLVL